jgi:hypothetical protein
MAGKDFSNCSTVFTGGKENRVWRAKLPLSGS